MNIEIPNETKDFLNNVISIFKNRFPNSNVSAVFVNNICPCIEIRFYLAKDKSECANNIMMNDPCRTIFHIYSVDQKGKLFDNKIAVERIYGNSIIRAVDPNNPKEKFLAYAGIPIKYRMMNNTKDNVLKGFQKYVNKIAQTIIDNSDAINNGIVKNLYDVKSKVRM